MRRVILLVAVVAAGCGGPGQAGGESEVEPTTAPASMPSSVPPATSTEASPSETVREEVEVAKVTYGEGFEATLCLPAGAGPFPAAVFNHGGLGTTIGGAPEETCEALAAAGIVGFSPIRRQTVQLDGHLGDVLAAVETVASHPEVAADRMAILGFSRGGMLTLFAAAERDFSAVVIMAAAPPRTDEEATIAAQSAPILLLVAANDLPGDLNRGQDLTQRMRQLHADLEAAGKDATLIVYPDFEPHGHMLFFEVGDYWADVLAFLDEHL